MLATRDEYRRITGDNATADGDVDVALRDAQNEVEHKLRRAGNLEDDGQPVTESLRVFFNDRSRVYPTRTPVTAVTSPSSALIADGGFAVEGVGVDAATMLTVTDIITDASALSPYPYLGTITYRGGYTPTTVPSKIKRVICRVANLIVAPPSQVPAGAISVKSGDVSVTYATPQDSEAAIARTLAELDGRVRKAAP